MTASAERFAVLGDPVAHSKSPAMHNAALEALGRPERYGRRRTSPDELAARLDELEAAGYRGVNLTVPLKRHALACVDRCDEVATDVGAANTIVFDEGERWATNTDPAGFLAGLAELSGPTPRRMTLLGAGGAGRAVAYALLRGFPDATLDWVSRGAPSPDDLLEQERLVRLSWDQMHAAGGPRGELVVNATTVGMAGGPREFPHPVEFPLRSEGARVVDVVYPRPRAGLLDRAEAAGHPVQDGRPMLLWQGVRALETWLGSPLGAEIVDRMRAALRA